MKSFAQVRMLQSFESIFCKHHGKLMLKPQINFPLNKSTYTKTAAQGSIVDLCARSIARVDTNTTTTRL